jgi:Fe-S-cluster containining protein
MSMRKTVIKLEPSECTMTVGEIRTNYRYSEATELRDDVRDYIYDLIGEHRLKFSGECGRCGNSCRRSDVLVRHQEILAFQQRFGISETAFREKYLEPAKTWNAGDGLMRLNADGTCPFLVVHKNGEEDGAHSTSCSVHDIRPRSCREYLSNQSSCRKDTGQLIESIARVTLDYSQVEIITLAGETVTLPANRELLASLAEKFEIARPNRGERFKKISNAVETNLDKLLKNFKFEEIDEVFTGNVATIRHLVGELAELVDLAPGSDQRIEEMWVKLRRLEALCSGQNLPQETVICASVEGGEAKPAFDWIYLQESSLQYRKDGSKTQSIQLAQVADLQKNVTALLQSLLVAPDSAFQESVQETNPECYMCGECCRFYAVEIKPSDIRRLCEILPVTPTEFVEKYTNNPRFGWNKKNRIFKKVPAPAYSKDLTSVKILGQNETEQCSFLERRDDGFFYCSVHSHKPQVCRNYGATNALCRNVNQKENWGRQISNLAWVEIEGPQIRLQTRERNDKQKPALTFNCEEFAELDAALQNLADALAVV